METVLAIFQFIIPVLTGAAVFGIVLQMVPDQAELEARRRLGMAGVQKRSQSLILNIVKLTFPPIIPFVRLIKVPAYRDKIRRNFVTAGMTEELTPDEFLAYKVVMAIFFPAFFGVTVGALISPIPWYGLILLTIYGFFFADMWLDGRIKLRQKEITKALPYVMDLLTLSVEAGLDFVAGIAKVVDKSKKSPLVEEFGQFLQELQVGNTRQQALRHLAKRIQMPEIGAFTALLIQADELGASIGPVLRAQSDLLRTQRFQRAEKAGAAAAQKILFPLVFCILPAVFIMIFGPIVLSFVYGEGLTGASS